MSAVIFDGVSKHFGDVVAVDSFSLEVREGEFLVLLGPSGCGKTTTLRMVAGFIKPTRGTIRIGETVVADAATMVPPNKRNLSMVFQSYAVWPHMTVAENISYGLVLKKVPPGERRRQVKRMLGLVKMNELGERYPAELSGGQQQRVALARALIVEPSILLLDEPLSNLDATLREEMRFEIRELHRRLGFTAIYVTHDQAEAMVLANRIVAMNAGKIEQVGTPQEIYLYPETAFVAEFIGVSNLVDGTVQEVDHQAGRALVCPDGWEPFWACFSGSTYMPEEGHEVRVSIRPEDILLSGNPPSNAVNALLRGRIQDATFLGSYSDVRVNIGEKSIRVNTEKFFNLNGEVILYFDPGSARILMK